MAIKPYYEDEHLTLYLGDSREVLANIDAPIYELDILAAENILNLLKGEPA